MRWRTVLVAAGVSALGAIALALFGPDTSGDNPTVADQPKPAAVATAPSPSADASGCSTCHGPIVAAYRDHGMSRSIGRVDSITPGTVTNPITKARYDITSENGRAWLTTTTPDGGKRRQHIVGRIGGGIFDTSWVASEVDTANGVATGRLFFAPVETLASSGHKLAPFDLHPRSPGPDMALTGECVTCHTLDRLDGGTAKFPANQVGPTAFDALSSLGCAACHGDTREHATIMRGKRSASGEAQGLGLTRIARLTAGAQRDICARCHLQGDARIDLVAGAPDRTRPIAAQIPVLVPKRTQTDFRFVGQMERLALSDCFQASPSMTCTTCHDPHMGTRAQGVESFDRACISCHKNLGTHTSLTPTQVTGEPARSTAGCIDCHVRRSQPFDLPHVRTADHFIRRSIERPQSDVPHRQFAARDGELMIYDDGRMKDALRTPAGRRWAGGVTAMGLLTMGRFAEAARLLEAFPPPGSPQARVAAAPPGFAPLETSPAFHTVRGFVLMGSGKIDGAVRAFSDAIAIDPSTADARMARARISLDAGDVRGAGIDTEAVIRAHPQAEQPWDLRIEIAQRTGRRDLALSAADASTRLWPSNPRTWMIVSMLAGQSGQTERSRQALERARALSPSVVRDPQPAAPADRNR